MLDVGMNMINAGGTGALLNIGKVAFELLSKHLKSLDDSGKHFNNRVDEIPYQVNGNCKECIGLFVGCRYPGTKSALKGCTNDLKSSLDTIQKLLGVKFRAVYIGCDDGSRESFFNIQDRQYIQNVEMFTPTKRNIEQYYERVLHEAGQDAFVWLHYSGHGGSQRDKNGDEDDGKDETLCPTDYSTNGVIVDDWLHDTINRVNPNVSMIACFDCCHSGTMLDLTGRENSRVIALSGCQDNQTSADCSPADASKGSYGAFTTCFGRAILNIREKQENPLDLDMDNMANKINYEIKAIHCSQRSLITKSNSNMRTLGQVIYQSNASQSNYNYGALPASQYNYRPNTRQRGVQPQNNPQQQQTSPRRNNNIMDGCKRVCASLIPAIRRSLSPS